MHYVYILASKTNGTLYTGSCSDLEGRIRSHKGEVFQNSFTKKYNVKILVHIEQYETKHERLVRERQLKKWKRAWKIELIEKNNPNWKDLSEEWFGKDKDKK